MRRSSVELGLGLLSIGPEWGAVSAQPPTEVQAMCLLETAVELGIHFFDTAPAYGDSEKRFGDFLRRLDATVVKSLTVSTKCGIHWDFARQKDYDDHSYDALCRSIDGSVFHLPRIDVLQLHRASVETISSPDVRRAFEYACSVGIQHFGVSVKDLPAAQLAVNDTLFQYIQLPLNSANSSMEAVLGAASSAGKLILVNRPFSMGALLYDIDGRPVMNNVKQTAFDFILRRPFSGYILTGTKSAAHLRENVAAFHQATASAAASI